MRLVLFDIDGTLTVSDGFGRRCFLEALADEFGIRDASSDWASYEHVTDAGISRQILRERHGREPQAGELERLCEAYHSRLEAALVEQPEAYQALPGAVDALARLGRAPEWRVGIASGNWRRAGRLKLRSAGFVDDGLVCGYSEDAIEKANILRAAVRAACERAPESFEAVVYVGDAPWDVVAAREAGVAFVGIDGRAGREEMLGRGCGFDVLEDYLDFDGFERTLARAQVPRAGAR